jgi:hypothetical protein
MRVSEDTDQSGLRPLAERLCAAYISAQMGLASVDYVIKRYVRAIGEPPSDLWFQIAAFVSDVMRQAKPLPETAPTKEGAALEISVPNRRKGRAQKGAQIETRKDN